jgi:hypothetical protein
MRTSTRRFEGTKTTPAAALGGGGELGRKEMTSPYRRLAEMVAASRHGTTSGPIATNGPSAPVVVSDRDVGQKKEMFFRPVVAYFAPEVSKTRRGILGGLIVERGGTLASSVDDPRVTHVLTTSTTYRHWDDTARLVSPGLGAGVHQGLASWCRRMVTRRRSRGA